MSQTTGRSSSLSSYSSTSSQVADRRDRASDRENSTRNINSNIHLLSPPPPPPPATTTTTMMIMKPTNSTQSLHKNNHRNTHQEQQLWEDRPDIVDDKGLLQSPLHAAPIIAQALLVLSNNDGDDVSHLSAAPLFPLPIPTSSFASSFSGGDTPSASDAVITSTAPSKPLGYLPNQDILSLRPPAIQTHPFLVPSPTSPSATNFHRNQSDGKHKNRNQGYANEEGGLFARPPLPPSSVTVAAFPAAHSSILASPHIGLHLSRESASGPNSPPHKSANHHNTVNSDTTIAYHHHSHNHHVVNTASKSSTAAVFQRGRMVVHSSSNAVSTAMVTPPQQQQQQQQHSLGLVSLSSSNNTLPVDWKSSRGRNSSSSSSVSPAPQISSSRPSFSMHTKSPHDHKHLRISIETASSHDDVFATTGISSSTAQMIEHSSSSSSLSSSPSWNSPKADDAEGVGKANTVVHRGIKASSMSSIKRMSKEEKTMLQRRGLHAIGEMSTTTSDTNRRKSPSIQDLSLRSLTAPHPTTSAVTSAAPAASALIKYKNNYSQHNPIPEGNSSTDMQSATSTWISTVNNIPKPSIRVKHSTVESIPLSSTTLSSSLSSLPSSRSILSCGGEGVSSSSSLSTIRIRSQGATSVSTTATTISSLSREDGSGVFSPPNTYSSSYLAVSSSPRFPDTHARDSRADDRMNASSGQDAFTVSADIASSYNSNTGSSSSAKMWYPEALLPSRMRATAGTNADGTGVVIYEAHSAPMQAVNLIAQHYSAREVQLLPKPCSLNAGVPEQSPKENHSEDAPLLLLSSSSSSLSHSNKIIVKVKPSIMATLRANTRGTRSCSSCSNIYDSHHDGGTCNHFAMTTESNTSHRNKASSASIRDFSDATRTGSIESSEALAIVTPCYDTVTATTAAVRKRKRKNHPTIATNEPSPYRDEMQKPSKTTIGKECPETAAAAADDDRKSGNKHNSDTQFSRIQQSTELQEFLEWKEWKTKQQQGGRGGGGELAKVESKESSLRQELFLQQEVQRKQEQVLKQQALLLELLQKQEELRRMKVLHGDSDSSPGSGSVGVKKPLLESIWGGSDQKIISEKTNAVTKKTPTSAAIFIASRKLGEQQQHSLSQSSSLPPMDSSINGTTTTTINCPNMNSINNNNSANKNNDFDNNSAIATVAVSSSTNNDRSSSRPAPSVIVPPLVPLLIAAPCSSSPSSSSSSSSSFVSSQPQQGTLSSSTIDAMHSSVVGRNDNNQHPISATGLQILLPLPSNAATSASSSSSSSSLLLGSSSFATSFLPFFQKNSLTSTSSATPTGTTSCNGINRNTANRDAFDSAPPSPPSISSSSSSSSSIQSTMNPFPYPSAGSSWRGVNYTALSSTNATSAHRSSGNQKRTFATIQDSKVLPGTNTTTGCHHPLIHPLSLHHPHHRPPFPRL